MIIIVKGDRTQRVCEVFLVLTLDNPYPLVNTLLLIALSNI